MMVLKAFTIQPGLERMFLSFITMADWTQFFSSS